MLGRGLGINQAGGCMVLLDPDGGGPVYQRVCGHLGKAKAEWKRCGRSPGYGGPRTRQAHIHLLGQRQRARPGGYWTLGGLQVRVIGPHLPQETPGERLH